MVKFDTERLAIDMALKGWNASRLATATELSVPTITRFLRGEVQTAKVAKKIARAMRRPISRYIEGLTVAL